MAPRIRVIGLDIAKDAFQLHGISAAGTVVARRQLTRKQLIAYFQELRPCLVGIEACCEAHNWARTLGRMGHKVRLMPPSYVKPYVKTNKNDAADAEAICEAVQRPNMRFVPVKSAKQQGELALHRIRELFVRQRAQLITALRSYLTEFGVVATRGRAGAKTTVAFVNSATVRKLPKVSRDAFKLVADQIQALSERIAKCEEAIAETHEANAASQRLTTIPGIGILTASAFVSTIGNGSQFRSGRDLAAWIGLVPRQNSSGGKQRLGAISKRGNRYLRRLLYLCACRAMRNPPFAKTSVGKWVAGLQKRKRFRVAVIALAAKLARIIWAVLANKVEFRPIPHSGYRMAQTGN
jgi:transposase